MSKVIYADCMHLKLIIMGTSVLAICAIGAWWYYTTRSANETPLTKDGARAIAEKKIRSDMVVVDSRTEEHNFGWVFFYTSRRYLETQNMDNIILGNGPIIVNRDGSVISLPTYRPPEILIAQYEQEYQSKIVKKICDSLSKDYILTEYKNDQKEVGGYVATSKGVVGAPLYNYYRNGDFLRKVIVIKSDTVESQIASEWRKKLETNYSIKEQHYCDGKL